MPTLTQKPVQVAEDHYLMNIEIEKQEVKPGQFVNIKIGTGTDPLLRRPFSVYDYSEGQLQIIFRVVGKGTSWLKDIQPGNIDMLGPLGKGFTIEENSDVLLIGGGVGAAPLYYLARVLKSKGCRIHLIYGASSEKFIYRVNDYSALSHSMELCTDDGTCGEKGLVTQPLERLLKEKKFKRIYACGPHIMMKNVYSISREHGEVEVSLENYFGCGIGLCVGCSVMTSSGFKRVCMDGPVFNASSIKWDNIE